MRIYNINESILEKIDDEWKAYFLGWMYSDGNIQKDLGRMRISLSSKDEYILEYFSKKFYNCIKLSYRNGGYSTLIMGNKCDVSPKSILTINRKKICEDLVRLGCVPCKSLILKFPTSKQVPDYLIHHFIRGYFDGDGTVRNHRGIRGRSEVGIISSKFFVKSLKKSLFLNKINSSIKQINRIYNLSICGNDDICSFANFIYKDATIYLKRKKDRFDNLFKSLNKANKNNKTSNYTGICYKVSINRYIARGTVNKIRYNIGCFKTEEEAFLARNAFLKERGVLLEKKYD